MDCNCDVNLHKFDCVNYHQPLPKGSYTINRRVSIDIKFPKKRLLEIFASDECWYDNGEFNKIQAIKILRDDENLSGSLGLKDAKDLVEDFMQSIFGAMSKQDIT